MPLAFQSAGECDRGSSCRYSHEGGGDDSTAYSAPVTDAFFPVEDASFPVADDSIASSSTVEPAWPVESAPVESAPVASVPVFQFKQGAFVSH